MSRRLFLQVMGSIAALPLLNTQTRAEAKPPTFPSDPFTLGVASGDVDHRSVDAAHTNLPGGFRTRTFERRAA